MNDYLEGLISELAYLERTIESMESHRNNTLSAIESISAVSEQTAASISVVNESLKITILHGIIIRKLCLFLVECWLFI